MAVLDEFTANMNRNIEIEVRVLGGLDPFPISLVTRSIEPSNDFIRSFQKSLSDAINQIKDNRLAMRQISLMQTE